MNASLLYRLKRPKAEALGYLDAKATAKARAGSNSDDNDKCNEQPQPQKRNTGILRCAQNDEQKQQQLQLH